MSRKTPALALLAAALAATSPARPSEPAAIYAALAACGLGVHTLCPRPPTATLAPLARERSFHVLCHEPIGADWYERVPVAASLDEGAPWLAYGPTLYVPIADWTPSPGRPLVEHAGAFVEAIAEDGFLQLIEAGWGPAHRAIELDLRQGRDGRIRARVRRTRLLRMAPGGEHGFGAELPLVDRHGWPSPALAAVLTPEGGRLARVVDAHAEWLDCDPLQPDAYEAAWLAWLDETARYRRPRELDRDLVGADCEPVALPDGALMGTRAEQRTQRDECLEAKAHTTDRIKGPRAPAPQR